ncbi:MAG: DUF2809 domain-containing protein [Clostridium sp.]|uniref:ribosomal maturation YjgA family protein n=1 Tax=Clostridium sp. TaxID=1506 RepID=UPI002FC75CE0
MKFKFNFKYLILFSITFIIELFIALFINDSIIRPFIGDILVVILIYFLIKGLFVIKTKLLPLYIFIFATFIEFLQYINIVKLLKLENNPILSVAIGQTFDINDIICYFIGCILIYIINRSTNL